MICDSGGSKSRLAKAAGVEQAGQMRDEKVHAVVARNTFRSQNAQNTRGSDYLWRFGCRKSMKKYRPLWREGHFEVNIFTALGGSGGLDIISLQFTLHYTPVHYITLHYTPVYSTTLNYTKIDK